MFYKNKSMAFMQKIVLCLLLSFCIIMPKYNNVYADTTLTQNIQYVMNDYEYVNFNAWVNNTGCTTSCCVGRTAAGLRIQITGVTADRGTSVVIYDSNPTEAYNVQVYNNTAAYKSINDNYYFTDADRATYKYFSVKGYYWGSKAGQCAHGKTYVGNNTTGSVVFSGCGTYHTHEYTSAVTTEATCTTDGETTWTCSCGDSYTTPIPAPGHTFQTLTINSQKAAERCIKCGFLGSGNLMSVEYIYHLSTYSGYIDKL